MSSMTKIILFTLICIGWLNTAVAEGEHTESQHESHDSEDGVIRMDADERAAEGITTISVTPRELNSIISAPGEVVLNAYRTHDVTPRIAAQIVSRKVKLGETVKKGQLLLVLSSVAMAEAQGNLIETDREWKRVQKLGRQIVSAKRYIAAQVARQRAYATVRAYGMSKTQISQLISNGDASRATGRFELTSPQNGTVIRDSFFEGEVVKPGRLLFRVTDESKIWVEAQLNPQQARHVAVGATVKVKLDNSYTVDGTVRQLHHNIDETTRTRAVRIEVNNANERLHPGEYVEVLLPGKSTKSSLAVPHEAITLMAGSSVVFKLDGNQLTPQPVQTGSIQKGWTVIRAGLQPGDMIVNQGTFLLKSLMLKSQMGEGHGH